MERSLRGVQIRRIFLRGMLGSLLIATVVAISALLATGFTDTTGRILGTFFSLAVYCALIIACAALIEKRRNALVSRVGLAGFTACFALVLFAVWSPALGWAQFDLTIKTLATAAYFLAAWVLALPCERVVETKPARWIGWIGLAAVALTSACSIAHIWDYRFFWSDQNNWQALAVGGLISFALAHICMLLLTPIAASAATLRTIAIAFAAATAGLWSLFVINQLNDDLSWRWLGALGIADAAATLAVIIFSRARGVDAVAKLTPGLAQIDLSCPRCQVRQTLVAGESACRACGLQFKIEVQESRCRKCDYPLWQLPHRRCPECGLEF